MQKFSNLFKPIKIGTMEVKNRIVLCPMGTGYADGVNNFPTERMAYYYGERAKGGTGLIIVEQTVVQKKGLWSPKGGGIWSDESLPYWKNVVDEVHKHGAKIVIQVGHLGRSTTSGINGGYQPVAPSPVPDHFLQEIPHELTIEEIEEFKNDYLDGVKRAKEAGFDGVEIHCTHGYLLASFLSGRTNKRTDKYGGTLEGRLRLPLEIVSMVRREIGRDYPLLVRMASHEANGGRNLEESKVIAKAFADAGIDAIDVSAGSFSELDWEIPPYYFGHACNMVNIEEIKKSVDVPVISSARITEPRMAEQLIAEGRTDMVGINRAAIADPFWAKKAGSGDVEGIRRCIGCTRCIDELFTSKDQLLKCTVNPLVSREGTINHTPAKEQKKVLVIGGGPSGLQAAVVAAQRGHKVTLVEKTQNLGGQVRAAAIPPKKYEIASLITYLSYEAEKAGVNIILGKEADMEFINEFKPSDIIVATGAKPLIPGISGINSKKVATALEVLEGRKTTGQRIAVIGAGMIGCETAEFLAEYGKQITVFEMTDQPAGDVGVVIRPHLLETLKRLGVELKTNTKVTAIEGDTILYSTLEGQGVLNGIDTIVLAAGMIPNNSLSKNLSQSQIPVHTIGDANNVSRILEALTAAYEIGSEI
ncbi:MAG: hypothetical protein K0R09_38 [Clostridiales bacterium]|jgi:2,4-dienoyl-CoA reductase-like NADH-dependent reductase (Old Yellow Enzyme family)/thioredoxin reductase|nr:hypothetical protein [Clostridiales bacterium]